MSGPEVSEAAARLLQAREGLGLTQKEVADKLYLTTTFIRYIDDGEFEKIPKPAFVRGYLRSYARVVGLSGDEIVALYESEIQSSEQDQEIRGVTEEPVGSASITGPVMQTGLIALIGLLVVMALVWLMVSGDSSDEAPVVTQPDLPGPVANIEAAEVETDTREGSIDAFSYIENPDDSPDQSAEPVPAGTRGATEPGPARETDVPASGQAAEPVVQMRFTEGEISSREETPDNPDEITIERFFEGGSRFINVNAGGIDQIELSFPDECWVEIRDDRLGLIYNDLNRENDRLTVFGSAPFQVLLGKATGVEMLYNGRPFNLDPYITRDRTAKVTISE